MRTRTVRPTLNRYQDRAFVEKSRSRHQPGTDFVRQAETLIRSLAGVVHASVHANDGGIDAIHVVAADDDSAAHMAGHVRSALLAGLATPVVPARIHVRSSTPAPRPASWDEDGATPAVTTMEAPGRDRLRLLHGGALEQGDTAAGPDAQGSHDPDSGRAHDELKGTPAGGIRAAQHIHRARLVAVDIRKPGDGRVVCRVSIAWKGEVQRAEAVAMDLPGAAAQAAAQAAVRALASSGVHGLELSGLREVEIAGRDYVLVALRRNDGPTVRHRSGSALMFGTPERSAAEAAVNAANELV